MEENRLTCTRSPTRRLRPKCEFRTVARAAGTVGDLLELARLRLTEMERRGRHLLLPRLTGELRANPELREPFIENVVGPARARLWAIFERGVEQRELRADLDPDLAVDLVGGPLLHRLVMGDEAERIIAHVPAVIGALMEGIGR